MTTTSNRIVGAPPGPTPAPKVVESVRHGDVLREHVRASGFGYLFPGLQGEPTHYLDEDHAAGVVALLRRLGEGMIEPLGRPTGTETIPAVYTYWGQFIDHDLTLEDSRNPDLQGSAVSLEALHPVDPEVVARDLSNARMPYLNLDSLYGDGPGGASAAFYQGAELRLGTLSPVPPQFGAEIPALFEPQKRDLRRIVVDDPPDGNRFPAQIGDSRNDENLMVSQLHVAYARFHNRIVRGLHASGGPSDKRALFEQARRVVTQVHQWLIVNDYLATITAPGTIGPDVLAQKIGDRYLARFAPGGEPTMPLEFSVAAFRFGHSQVRDRYDHNRNFGAEAGVAPFATLQDLFQFVGRGGFRGSDTLPSNWPVEWERFVSVDGTTQPVNFARPIDTRLADGLAVMPNEDRRLRPSFHLADVQEHLAKRNLLRGYLLSVPTGEAVAEELGVTPLTADELTQGAGQRVRSALDGLGAGRTPLWYYLLKEAEVVTDGATLGPVGSKIVAETVVGLLRHERGSTKPANPWKLRVPPQVTVLKNPTDARSGTEQTQVTRLGDLLRLAGVTAP